MFSLLRDMRVSLLNPRVDEAPFIILFCLRCRPGQMVEILRQALAAREFRLGR